MSAEIRKEFETQLVPALQGLQFADLQLKASKNKLKIGFQGKKAGEIYLQHLRNAGGYYAGLHIETCDALTFCLAQQPPYASRLPNSAFMAFSSLSETDNVFGDDRRGTIRTPPATGISQVVEKVCERLGRLYLPRAHHCVSAAPALLDDIVANPGDYAFPFLSAVYVAHKHQVAFNSACFQRVLIKKRIMGNKQFDLELAERLLPTESAKA